MVVTPILAPKVPEMGKK